MPVKSLKGGIGVRPLGFGLGVAEEEVDPNFNSNILLIHADGSEGEGNTPNLGDPSYKAFQDNSSANNQIVVNGDAYGNDFSPYYYANGYWSNSFSSSGDRLSMSASSDFQFGTGDFTVELFVNFTTAAGDKSMVDFRPSNTNYSDAFGFTITGTALKIYDNGNKSLGGTLSIDTWHHVVLQRVSGTLYAHIDGTATGTTVSYSTDLSNSSTQCTIGSVTGASSAQFGGYISNLRIVKGTAIYGTGSFTPSTSPFTTTSQSATASEVKLLTCQSNYFLDNSNSGHTISVSGTPSVSTNSPFTQSKTANVGSGFIGATSADLEVKVSNLPTGNDNRTIECWLFFPSGQTFRSDTEYIVAYGQAATSKTFSLAVKANSGKPELRFVGYSNDFDTGVVLELNQWNHISLSYNGSTDDLKYYVNGVLKHTGNTGLNTGSHTALWINAEIGGGDTYVADMFYIADLAIYNTILRTDNFTPPTSTVGDTANTKVLTCQYAGSVHNEGFLDDGKYNSRVVPTSNVALGTFSPFSLADTYWSNYLNGNHPIEIADSGSGLDLSGDFTLEFWAFEPKIATTGATVNLYFTIDTLDRFQFSNNGSNIVLYINGGSVFSSTTPPLNQWNHIALVREGSGSNNLSYYLNGTRQTQATNTYSIAAASMMLGGQDRGGTTGYHGFFGYLSNFRILKGTALYSGASITVPTEPLTAITNTSLLTCQSNHFVDNSTNNMALTTDSGSPAKVMPFSPFAPSRSYTKDVVGGSFYNPASSQYLEIQPQQTDNFYFYGDFTLEGWLYSLNTSDTSIFIGTGGNYFALNVNPHDNVTFYANSGSPTVTFNNTSSIFKQGEWKHIALVRSSSTIKLYVNGVADSTTGSNSSALGYSGQKMRLGSTVTQEYFFAFPRISNSARYTSNFTPQTTPWTSSDLDANALFASNFTNAGIIDRTAKNVLRTIGNTRTTTTDKKFGTGSLVFDGDDYLEAVATENRELFTPETGDMTWEMFVKFDILDGEHALFSKYGSGSEYQFYYSNGSNEWRLSYHATTNAWSDSSISTGTWYHIALVKDGTTVYLFKDGTSLGTNTMTYNTSQTGRNFVLGVSFNGANSALYQLKGKLDEVRVTRLARYTSNFTAPTKAFPNR
jgi:hypothetical protein